MILPQKLFYPIVENCFHFAFRHDFLAVTRKPQQRIEAKAKMRKGIPKIKANDKNPVNLKFILHSGHGCSEVLKN